MPTFNTSRKEQSNKTQSYSHTRSAVTGGWYDIIVRSTRGVSTRTRAHRLPYNYSRVYTGWILRFVRVLRIKSTFPTIYTQHNQYSVGAHVSYIREDEFCGQKQLQDKDALQLQLQQGDLAMRYSLSVLVAICFLSFRLRLYGLILDIFFEVKTIKNPLAVRSSYSSSQAVRDAPSARATIRSLWSRAGYTGRRTP